MKHFFFFWLCLLFSINSIKANGSISIFAPNTVHKQPVSKFAIQDIKHLLSTACSCEVTLGDKNASVQIKLPQPSIQTFHKIQHQKVADSIPYFYYPKTNFTWSSKRINGKTILNLETSSYEGVAAALYALLQEKLGFRFYHPKESILPKWNKWPLASDWDWSAKERFNKRGFHLHTMHPLELTEALLDENFPNGQELIKEYIQWLARNGQNYFEFNLLNSIEMDTWIPYIKETVNYAHDRGIIMGADISLNMIQQKAFKLYKKIPYSFKPKKEQIIQQLNHLAQANFDVYNIEMSSTEYNSGKSKKRQEQMNLILDWAKENQIKIIGRAHVVKKGDAVLNYTGESQKINDSERGVLIHTVMFYELNDEKAPVYGNKNLKHMFDLMKKEQAQRETWYFPESAYWVTFDNSVPMFLLPYLSARLTDIKEVEKEGITGHLTFSSGWEWTYWLIDWSIARWSWDYGYELHEMESIEMLVNDSIAKHMNKIHQIQDYYLKEKELIRYLAAQSVMDEIPKKISKEFQPRPKWRYPYLFNKASQEELDEFKKEGIDLLEEYINAYQPVLIELKNEVKKIEPNLITTELIQSLDITILRAYHRLYCLKAIHIHRMSDLNPKESFSHVSTLQKATQFRMLALDIVKEREKNYRYDLNLLSTKRKGHTAYHFGYLYPVSELHFWEREEEQILNNKWGYRFMNIWNIWRIMGIKK